MTKKRKVEGVQNPRFTRSVAIRLKCIDCSARELAEVRKCEIRDCPLWEYRLGPGRTEPLENNLPVHGREEF
jgi:hypothetical protein